MLILLTTSDYFPKLGGLSTFTWNVEKTLRKMNLEYKLFHWESYKEIINFSDQELKKYDLIINIHPQFAWMSKNSHEKMINFFHGSEILLTSSSLLKKIAKRLCKKRYLKKLEASNFNVFISEFTFNKINQVGHKRDYSRDIIVHNCIDTKNAEYTPRKIGEKIVFSCIVRNVPHKNLEGTVHFCEMVAQITGKKIELLVPLGTDIFSDKVQILKLKDLSEECRNQAYKEAHYNLLLSKDESKKGYFEGFGLTVLEAASFGTPSIVLDSGGLKEAVHHGETGWVLNEISREEIGFIFQKHDMEKYDEMSRESFNHVMNSHTLREYENLFKLFVHTMEKN